MLKIKDNVDLKELEKFGFKCVYNKYEFPDDEYYVFNSVYVYCKGKQKGMLLLDGVEYDLNEVPSIIFDLIQAGLVEKVEK